VTKLFTDYLSLFFKLLAFVQKRPGITVGLSLLFVAFCTWGLKHTRFELDIYDVYDPNFQSSVDLSDIKEFYNDQSQILIAFKFKSPPRAVELCQLLRWSQKLTWNSGIKNVTSLWSIRAPKIEGEKLWYPKTLQDPCGMPTDEIIKIDQSLGHSYFRHLVSQTGTLDLVFDVSFSERDTDVSKIQNLMDNTQDYVTKNLKLVEVKYLGLASFRYYFRKIMQKDSIYSLLVVLIIFLFMRLVYGTWVSGLLLVLTLIGAGIILYGCLAWVGAPIDILTNNLFLMTAVSGTADFIFVSQHQMKNSYQESLEKLIAPCFFTTLTTVVGFLSLNTSDLALIRRFGNGAAIGGLAEWAMLFIFLPAFLKLIKKEKVWVNPAKALNPKWFDKIESLSLPQKALKFLLVLMSLSVPAFFFLNDQDSPVKNLPSSHILRIGYEDFQKKFSWQGQAHLYFPEMLEAETTANILNQVAKLRDVFRVENPEEMAQEWTKGLPPLKQDLIRRELSMTPLWEKYYSNEGTLRIPLYLKEQDLHSLRKLRNKVDAICGQYCRLAGQRIVYLEYGERISKTMIESFAVSILLVIGILYYLLWASGKLLYLWPVILSSLMGPLVTLTLISIFQIPVTLITSIFLSIMVGLAGDNAIQYILVPDENLEVAIESRARASVMVSFVMILGSAMFLFQSLLPMRILGGLFIFGFLINLLGDLWGLKGLLTKKADQ
jgi:predicted RND superfamily exporter protein